MSLELPPCEPRRVEPMIAGTHCISAPQKLRKADLDCTVRSESTFRHCATDVGEKRSGKLLARGGARDTRGEDSDPLIRKTCFGNSEKAEK